MDLSECSFMDAKSMILEKMRYERIPFNSVMSFIVYTNEWMGEDRVNEIIRKQCEVVKFPPIRHVATESFTDMDEWCLCAYGVDMQHLLAKEGNATVRSKDIVVMKPFQYSVWSAGA